MSALLSSRSVRHVARWRAIGCDIHVETRRGTDLPRARRVVAEILDDIDAVASRFRDDSDLSAVNRSPGEWVEVDPLLVAAVRVAVTAADRTGGLVHPLLGRRLVELGYDRTFGALRPLRPAVATMTPMPDREAWRRIGLREAAIRVPEGTALDLGATAKAWCTDLAITGLIEAGVDAAIVSLGGDLRTLGEDPWEIAIAEVPGGPPDALVEVRGAVATSSTRGRHWASAGQPRHHLIDPRTGEPACEVWRTVTVAASTCVDANTATTEAIVRGSGALGRLRELGLPARLVDADGGVVSVGGWPEEGSAR